MVGAGRLVTDAMLSYCSSCDIAIYNRHKLAASAALCCFAVREAAVCRWWVC